MENLTTVKLVNHAIRFILEIISLIAIGYWVFQIPKGIIIKYAAGIGSVLLIMVIWGNFGAPAATYRLQGLSRLALEMVIYGFAFGAISFIINMKWAMVFGLVVFINIILLSIWN